MSAATTERPVFAVCALRVASAQAARFSHYIGSPVVLWRLGLYARGSGYGLTRCLALTCRAARQKRYEICPGIASVSLSPAIGSARLPIFFSMA